MGTGGVQTYHKVRILYDDRIVARIGVSPDEGDGTGLLPLDDDRGVVAVLVGGDDAVGGAYGAHVFGNGGCEGDDPLHVAMTVYRFTRQIDGGCGKVVGGTVSPTDRGVIRDFQG